MGKRCISARAVGFFFHSSIVNCRIGSLEIALFVKNIYRLVNCRIGSLENYSMLHINKPLVNCRIGSLEIHQSVQVLEQ